MKWMKKNKFYLIPFVVILIGVGFALCTRFSFTDAGSKVYDYEFGSGIVYDDVVHDFKNNKISSPNDMIQNADLIVKCKFDGERQIVTNAFYSQVNVLEVYKGNKALKGKNICLIEGVATYIPTHYMNSTTFSVILHKGNEYLLLLKKEQFDPTRKLTDFEDSEYYPVSRETAFGTFRLTDKKQTTLLDGASQKLTYNNLKDVEVYVYDQKTLDTYYQYKNAILKKFGL